MSDFLHEMAALSAERARSARELSTQLEERLLAATPPARLDVSGPGFDLIAEAKLASPIHGVLVTDRVGTDTVVDLARHYEDAGSVAISVLTEESTFGGDLHQLQATADAVHVPVMRKDFLVDPIQVIEARAAGASGVLLIARILSRHLLEEMADLAIEHAMFVLVEVFDRSDLDFATRVFDRDVLVGVNCRDLTTLQID
ncbi:MAG TPA: indole-3-glycerol-phosphate synthase TrpC, partial [Acidimicrobiia bacterium]|nr:indole-3-glycerol-phosphate synthase TrpC [Acidimicrobiia bacterium]